MPEFLRKEHLFVNLFSQFTCDPENQEMISPDLIGSLGIPPEDIYASVENICAISTTASRLGKRDFALLPFCHTVEAKAMGADIRPADETAGPRAGAYTLSGPGALPLIDISLAPDASNLIKACSVLKGEGRRVVYQISGPLSIFSCLMPLSALFKCWRKDPDTVAASLERLRAALSRFTGTLCDAGIEYLSYSDPAGSANILGPKYSKLLTDQFTLPFLKQVLEICGARCSVLICPMTAAALSAGEHIAAVSPGGGDLAVRCVKRGGCARLKNFKLC